MHNDHNKSMKVLSRRDFLKTTTIAAGAVALNPLVGYAQERLYVKKRSAAPALATRKSRNMTSFLMR
jgi:hypothetical protein